MTIIFFLISFYSNVGSLDDAYTQEQENHFSCSEGVVVTVGVSSSLSKSRSAVVSSLVAEGEGLDEEEMVGVVVAGLLFSVLEVVDVEDLLSSLVVVMSLLFVLLVVVVVLFLL